MATARRDGSSRFGLVLAGLLWALVGAFAGPAAAQPGGDGSGAAAQDSGTGQPAGPGQPAGTGEGAQTLEEVLEAASALYRSGDGAAASALVESHLAAHPEDRFLALLYARTLGTEGDFDGEIAFLREHLSRHPDDGNAANELGVLLLALLEYEEAAAYLERVQPSDGNVHVLAQMNLGKCYRALGRFEAARAAYQAMLDNRSFAVFAEAALCEIDLAMGELDACQARLRAARARYDDHAALAQPAAYLAYLRGDLDAAEIELARLLSDPSPSGRVQALRVLDAIARGELEAARSAVEGLTDITLRGEKQLLAALVAHLAGNPDEAADAYAAALERNTTFGDADRTARILLWRPELSAALQTLAQSAAVGEGTGQPSEPIGSRSAATEGSGGPATSGADADRDGGGCCRTAPVHPLSRSAAGIGALLVALSLLALRRRRARSAPPLDRAENSSRNPG